MRNIKLTLSFDGTEFSGWQRQFNARTIQGEIEAKLAVMTSEDIVVHGAGRTDAGVHALAMTAHYLTSSQLDCSVFRRGLNSLLPNTIKILHVEDVDLGFHSRIHATGKVYQYFFTTEELVFPSRRLYCAHLPGGFDLDTVTQCLPYLEGTHDFSSFEATGSRDLTRDTGRGAVRQIFSAKLSIHTGENREFLFEISGNGFLRKMVRNIVGTLIDVGQHRMDINDFKQLFHQKDRSLAGPTAPACGLFLKKVFYD